MGVNLDTASRPAGVIEWSIVGMVVASARREGDDTILAAQIVEVGNRWLVSTALTRGGRVEEVAESIRNRVQGDYASLAIATGVVNEILTEWLEA